MKQTVRIGCRESELAIAQAETVIRAVNEIDPDIEFHLVTYRNVGGRNQSLDIDSTNTKVPLTRDIENALASEKIDIAVHSFRDMPYSENPDFPVVALTERVSALDALVLPEGISELDNSLPVGTSSLRRAIQFKRLHPDADIAPIRGNITTRLAKLDLGEYSAVILSLTGLIRLGHEERVSRIFTAEEMIPSGSQGIIAIQSRLGDNCAYLAPLHSWRSETVSLAERQFLRTMTEQTTFSTGVFAELRGEQIVIMGMFVSSDGKIITSRISGEAARAQSLGEELALKLLAS